ncbi:hypothetical protein [Pandoraea sputorum]|uniref:Uncharacterized protein n=1 Tax=Pandoraea sputorum TaxID=93222 RepID=A0A5E5ANM0_9BURK|nr:hypothetical protein [Pandoraea sputorum]VVE74175.1 hypothetical protein PSP31121_00166 [Pandoraea sputorum]
MASISLQSVAYNSRATLDRLGEPGNGATIENGRIGVNDKGQLVVFKGKAFLLHLEQCYRADKLIKANDLSTHASASLRAALKFKDLRLGKQSTDTLIRRMNLTNALPKIDGASNKAVCFESLLAGMPDKTFSSGGPRSPHSQASVRITTQPPMALEELKWLVSTADDNLGTPVAATPPKRPPRKIDPPFMHHPMSSSPSPSTVSSHSFEFLPGAPLQTPTSGTAPPSSIAAASGNARTRALSTSDSPAFLDDLHRGGVARDALIRTMLVNSAS